MCLKGGALPIGSGSGGSVVSEPKSIHVKLFKVKESDYVVFDVNTKEDFEKQNIPNSKNVVIQDFLVNARDGKMEDYKGKKLVIACKYGEMLSKMVVRELTNLGFDAYVLQGGVDAYYDEKKTTYSWVGVLGCAKDDVERITMSLTQAYIALSSGNSSVLILMGDCVHLAKPNALDNMWLGDPFKKCNMLFSNFMKEGGLVTTCHSCNVKRGLKKDDFVKGVDVNQGPDVVRWLMSSKGSLQHI